jgi:TolA-binding protein
MSSEPAASTAIFDILGWLETNKKRLLVGALAATAVGFGIAAYRYKVHENEVAASSSLLQLKNPATSRGATNLPTSSDYLKVEAQFGGTDAAQRAALLAGGTYFGEGKYAEAQQQFEKFLKNHPDSPWAPEAAFGVAVALDGLNKLDDAARAYQDVMTRHGASPVASQAQLALGRIYEVQGKPDQALKVYEELARAAAMNSWAPEAVSRKESLLAKFPNLVKPTPAPSTNAPAAATAPAPASQPPAGK